MMTDAGWRKETDPTVLLEAVTHEGCGSLPRGGRFDAFASVLWLFCAACCRRSITEDSLGTALPLLEDFAIADDWNDRDSLIQAFMEADDIARSLSAAEAGPARALVQVLSIAAEAPGPGDEYAACKAADVFTGNEGLLSGPAQCELLRELFGDEARPVDFDPSWPDRQNGTVARIATAIWQGRDFANLAVLADALERAGCTEPTILHHCRSPKPHVLGCWALDLLLQRPR